MHPSVWTAAAMEKISPSGPRVSHLDNNIPLVFAAKKKKKEKRKNNRAPAAELGTALWLASLLIKASLPSPSPTSSSLKSS